MTQNHKKSREFTGNEKYLPEIEYLNFPAPFFIRLYSKQKLAKKAKPAKHFHVPHCLECIVSVHDGVYQVIHCDEPSGGRSVFRERIPTVQQNGNMVIPVIK